MAERPVDPELQAAVRLARQLSRRRFLTRSGLGVGGAMLAPTFLAACGDDDGGGGGGGGGEGAAAGNGSTKLTISNWDAYIDEDESGAVDGPGTTIADFQEAAGVNVTYRKDFNDNDEYFNKIYSPVLGKGKRINPDITVPTYWMAARIIGLDWTEELPLDQIPNHKNLDDSYLDLAWDPGAKHHMPWQAGITGIAWNPELTGGDLRSVNDLYDPKLKGKVTFFTELRDTVGLTMFGLGTDPASANLDDINAALDKIEQARDDGQVLKFTGNEYLRSLENGDVAASIAWSGDIAQLDPELGIKFIIPEEGGMQWFDTMTVPKGARNTVAAAKWMDYVYDPENAARITEWVQYISPVKGVREVLEAAGGESAALAENTLIFPDEETTSRLKVFGELEQEDEIAVQTRFNDITG
ncbi:MAG TPA: spermidine/putrescine ABC transporter substrate-binding protein [Aquihabitans sp.]|jgi:spermidine/putrescine transport system substrate-binding protein|nr:spermidine/putrescine ABC transporter substrate-binding protein [Aquihabitans sp.]